MLSDIKHFWPPPFGQPEVGYKKMSVHGSSVEMKMNDLHESAWWTGLRLTAYPHSNAPLRVQLHASEGFDFPQVITEWTQIDGEWTPFPYPIPARMAATMKLRLVVQTLNEADITMCASFHEMFVLPPNDKYLFVSDTGQVQFYWNGRRRAHGNPESGAEPAWRSVHYVVPTMRFLINSESDSPQVFCIHGWDETVPMHTQH